MIKFKVGDLVRVIRDKPDNGYHYSGALNPKAGEIFRIDYILSRGCDWWLEDGSSVVEPVYKLNKFGDARYDWTVAANLELAYEF